MVRCSENSDIESGVHFRPTWLEALSGLPWLLYKSCHCFLYCSDELQIGEGLRMLLIHTCKKLR